MAEPVPLGKLDELNLSNELTEVVDWHQLGIQLGIPISELSKIEADYPINERRKTETLSLWLKRTPNASWGDVVRALRQMGENRVAENIATKSSRTKEGSPPTKCRREPTTTEDTSIEPIQKSIELRDVYEELITISHKWFDLGLRLELEEGKLETIELANPNKPQHCLRAMC